MSDAIYRQQAIDTIKELREVAWKNWHEPTLSPNVVIDALSDLPSAPSWTGEWIPWIPCSERLPEDGTEVFVYLFNMPSPYIAWIEDTHWYTEDFEVERENEPIAWMPLPQPYTEETNA